MVLSRSAARAWRRSPSRFLRRAFSDGSTGTPPPPTGSKDPSILLREVMRNVAQPVAIAVTSVPPSSPLHGKAKYHGATLTSFTSLTLYPYPLVAFSLRLPSRMAECLRPWRTHSDHAAAAAAAEAAVLAGSGLGDGSGVGSASEVRRSTVENQLSLGKTSEAARARSTSPEPNWPMEKRGIQLPPKKDLPWPLSKLPMPEQPPEWAQSLFAQIPNPLAGGSDNPLSPSASTAPPLSPLASPSSTATATSTELPRIPTIPHGAQTHPTPLTISLLSTSNERMADQLSLPRTDHASLFALEGTWASHATHPPSLIGAVGALQCQVVGSVLLRDLCGETSASASAKAKGDGSELFICRVVDVELPEEDEKRETLLHWRQRYAGVKDS